MFDELSSLVCTMYPGKEMIALHEPVFSDREKRYVLDTIDSTFVSSVGRYVNMFETALAQFTQASGAVATVNGTSALHAALLGVGVLPEMEVLTQALTFVATANAIIYCGAQPVFLDSDKRNFGLSVESLEEFLEENVEVREDGRPYNQRTGRPVGACVPVHIFGHPVRIDEIISLCEKYGIPVVEDAAESLGSLWRGVHTGNFGKVGVFSFNGNKIVTTGGGGAIISRDVSLLKSIKHLTTTAKQPHTYEFYHDQVGYNYRLPNINAALGVAQLERLDEFLEKKRKVAKRYKDFFESKGIEFHWEQEESRANFWLNAVILESRDQRDFWLEQLNKRGILARPVWTLMTDLPMYKNHQHGPLTVARDLHNRVVNLPSGVPL